MMDRVYISNLTAFWTPEKQRELLAEVIARPHVPVYEDILSARARKAKGDADLVERANLLRETTRRDPETIHVASMCVLARDEKDLMAVYAAAWKRNATIVAHDTGLTIPPIDGAVKAQEGMVEFRARRQGAQTAMGQHIGSTRAAENKLAATAAKIERIRLVWHLKEPPTAEILKAESITYATIVQRLGKRPAVQAAYAREQEAKERRKARKEAKK